MNKVNPIEKAPPKQSIHFNETQWTIEISNRKTQHEGINEVQNKREEKQVYLIVLWNTKKLCCGVIGYFLPFFWKLLAFWCPFLSCLSFGCFLPFYYFPLIKNNTINPSIAWMKALLVVILEREYFKSFFFPSFSTSSSNLNLNFLKEITNN